MNTLDFLFLLGFKTAILSMAVVIAWSFLKILRCRSPKMHCTVWGAVLLLGIIGAGLPISIPVAKTPTETEIVVLNAVVPPDATPAPVAAAWPEVTIPFENIPEPVPVVTEKPVVELHGVYHPATNRIEIVPETKKTFSAETAYAATVVCWLAGIAGFLLWRFALYLLLLRRLKTANVVTGDAAGQWNYLCTESNIRLDRLPLLLTDHLGPGLVWRPTGSAVLVPSDLWEETTPEIREGILRHELAHYRNGDMIRSGVARLLALVHWFNPLAWFALKKMDEATEWVCDLAAFGTMTDGTLRFAQSMVAVHEAAPTVLLNRYAFGGGTVSQRAKKLQEFFTQPKESLMKRVAISSLFAVCLLFGTLQIHFVTVAKDIDTKTKEPETSVSGLPREESLLALHPETDVSGSLGDANHEGIAVELTDPDGKPARGGYIRAYPDPKPKEWDGFAKNFDIENGKCRISLPERDKLKNFKMIIYADGFAPFEADWKDLKGDPLPEHFIQKLLPAETVGGIVVDEDGKPVADAKVDFHVNWGGQNRNGKSSDGYVCGLRGTTDAEGRWTCSNVRKEELDRRKSIAVSHPDYARSKTEIMLRGLLPNADGNFPHKIILSKGPTVTGKVLDQQGKPVENVLVFANVVRESINNPDETRTDAKGEFKFENCVAEPKNQLYVGVCKGGFAPDLVSFAKITPQTVPLEFTLKPGKTMKVRVVDSKGNGLKDVSVSPAKWRGIRGNIVRFFESDRGAAKTDDEGRFVWHNAPNDEFQLSIWRGGYMSGEHAVKLGDEENVYTLRPYMIVDCKVFDAETKQPIPTLKVTYGTGSKSGDPKIFWSGILNPGQIKQTPEGFQWTQRQPPEEFGKWLLRVDVDGYETCVSEPLAANTDHQVLEFALKKKKPDAENPDLLIGTILAPDGKPAEGAQVGFATTARKAQVDNGRINFDSNDTVKTDAAGKFRLSKLDTSINEQDYKLIFLHDSGFAAIRKEEFEKRTEPIKLERWGRIEGVVYTGKNPAKDAWASISYRSPDDDFTKDRPYIDYFYRIPCDENGRFVFDRVFPGKGKVGQSITIDNGGSWPFCHLQDYEVKPGETLTVKIGGGGYGILGIINIPGEEEFKNVDWRFAHVTAQRTVPERYPVPPRNPSLQRALQKAPELNNGWYPDPEDIEKAIRRWEESPEGKAYIEKNPEAYKKEKEGTDIFLDYEKKKVRSWNDTVSCIVNDQGAFRLNDLAPGNWTLKITLHWPKVPGQYWDYLDTWKKEMTIVVPELPGGPEEEPLNIGPITLGFDKSERKGAER